MKNLSKTKLYCMVTAKSLSEKCERLKKPEKNGRIALTVGFGPSVHH
jgi:hypothetical protein